MSKLRQDVEIVTGDLQGDAGGDLAPYVVFTRLKQDGPFVYAGWVDECDDAMAMHFACEHYGQDQACTCLCVIHRKDLYGTEAHMPLPSDAGERRAWVVFRQNDPGGLFSSVDSVEAESPAAAVEASAQANANAIWVAPQSEVIESDPDAVIWRYTDQSYRLARGYGKLVRQKWEAVRAERAINEYEKEDIKESF